MGPWYRGQADLEWKLQPALLRQNRYGSVRKILSGEDSVEDEIVEEFCIRAPAISEVALAKSDDRWGWWFLMRHFGAPTRLLDWTEGALLALYFAVKDNFGNCDAAVWALDPYRLNRRAYGRIPGCPQDWVVSPCWCGASDEELKAVRPWLPRKLRQESHARLPEQSIAINPTHIAPRIGTQQSCFTVHGRDPTYLDRLHFEGNGRKYLVKLRIPYDCVASTHRELAHYGVDETRVFLSLDALGKALELKWQKRRDYLPHHDVYTRLRESAIDGVGVFAIRRIKKGMKLFPDDNTRMVWIDKSRTRREPAEIRRLYEDFAVIRGGLCGCPRSFNQMTMAWYLNEPKQGDRPNVRCDAETYEFYALRNIRSGEELTVDYETFSEEPGSTGGEAVT